MLQSSNLLFLDPGASGGIPGVGDAAPGLGLGRDELDLEDPSTWSGILLVSSAVSGSGTSGTSALAFIKFSSSSFLANYSCSRPRVALSLVAIVAFDAVFSITLILQSSLWATWVLSSGYGLAPFATRCPPYTPTRRIQIPRLHIESLHHQHRLFQRSRRQG